MRQGQKSLFIQSNGNILTPTVIIYKHCFSHESLIWLSNATIWCSVDATAASQWFCLLFLQQLCSGGYDGGGGVSQRGGCHERNQTPQPGTAARYDKNPCFVSALTLKFISHKQKPLITHHLFI